MTKTIYIGEQVVLAFDLDTSLTDDDYDLNGATPVLRLAKPGEDANVLSATGTVTDATEGQVSVTLLATDTEDLAQGVYDAQLIDTATPVLLWEGQVEAKRLISSTASTSTTGTFDVTYEEYIEWRGGPISAELWPVYHQRAQDYITDLCGTAHTSLTATYDVTRVKKAVARVADALWKREDAPSSESKGAVSVSYAEPWTDAKVRSEAVTALSGLGVTYRGVPSGD